MSGVQGGRETAAPSVLLVVGDRALFESQGGTRQSFRWMCETIRAYLESARPDLVISEGGTGPGGVATAFRAAKNLAWLEFRKDGSTDGTRTLAGVYQGRWRDEAGPAVSWLERDAAMVQSVLGFDRLGWKASGLGLLAPWVPVHEDHALVLAHNAGIRVSRLECPAEYAGTVSHGSF